VPGEALSSPSLFRQRGQQRHAMTSPTVTAKDSSAVKPDGATSSSPRSGNFGSLADRAIDK